MVPPNFNDGSKAPDPGETVVSGAASPSPQPSATGRAPDTGPLPTGKPFGARYHIIRLLGIGGMGAVYQAWDQELGVAVALKVILPEAVADPIDALDVERRFKRELLLARQVTHRNVVRIHDLGEIDGVKYITMPFVEGEDLSTRLRRDTKLPVAAALAIARQIVAGLAAAHEAGVVHRDLKPANIMIGADGQALIMDFGIARSEAPAAPAPGATADPDAATMVTADLAARLALPGRPSSTPRFTPSAAAPSIARGAIVGTVEFMAPEQARGQVADARADIYAFGMIFMEMLLGRRRTPPHERLAALEARITTPPVSLRKTDAAIPEAIDEIVLRCLQLKPADRFQTTPELVAAFDRIDAEGRVIAPAGARRLTPAVMAAGAAVVVLLVAGTWWMARGRGPEAPAPPHAPLSILIADFDDGTHDPVLQSTVEQSFGIALEGASFITAFPRSTARSLADQLKSAHGVDEATARLIAVREGVNVVLAGRIEASGSGYRLGVRALDPQGKELQTLSANAATKADLLPAVSQLASKLRDRFGDTTPASARQADAETFTAASLDAVREYAQAQDLASGGKDEDAIAHYRAALGADPNFGRAHSGWAVSARKLGRLDEATDEYKQAFALLDRMTEREKLRTLGAYYLQFAGAYDKAIETFSELVNRYPADRAGHSNLAIAYFYVLDFPKAAVEAQEAIKIYPRNPTFHSNYALFAMYASDFKLAATEGESLVSSDATFHKGYLPIAIARIDAGDMEAASAVYTRMANADAAGASLASSGMGDLAILTGRYADAETTLRAGIIADEQAKRTEGAVAKYTALGEALLGLGRTADARKAVEAAAALSTGLAARVPAALLLIRTGAEADARKMADDLGAQIQPQKRAYAKILEAEIALARHQPGQAVEALQAARKFADHWLGRFDLGVAYVQASAFPEAVSELETAQKRRGEAAALFLDDWPTVHYVGTLPYWLGRAHEGLGTVPAARSNYEAFLKLRAGAVKDPLVIDAQKRLAALGK